MIADLVRYTVRVSGLALVVVLGAMATLAPLISSGGSVLMPIVGLWIAAAAVLSWPKAPGAWKKDPPSERQLEYAESLGIIVPPGASKGDVSSLISAATGR